MGSTAGTTQNRSRSRDRSRKRRRKSGKSTDPDQEEADCDDEQEPAAGAVEIERSPTPPLAMTFADQVIRLTDSACWLLLTEQSVTIAGLTRITCCAGNMEMAGYRMTSGSEPLVLPSFDCDSWLSIFARGDAVTIEEFEANTSKLFAKELVESCCDVLRKFPGQIESVLLLSSSNAVSDPLFWHCAKMFPALLPPIRDEQQEGLRDPNAVYLANGKNLRIQPFPGCDIISAELMQRIPRNIEFNVSSVRCGKN